MATPRPRRPIAGSRAPSAAPRKIAGRGRATQPPAGAADDPAAEVLEHPTLPGVAEPAPLPPAPPPALPPAESPYEERPPAGLLGSVTTTRVLAIVLAVLAVVGGAELFFLLSDPVEPTEDRPVATTELDTELAVDDATRQLTEILEFTWRDYDEQTEDALSRIAEGEFKEEYAQTAADTRAKVLAQKAEYSVQVHGSGVMEAGPDEVTTLVFLDQIVFRGQGKDRVGPEVYPFRIEITTVRDGDRWLVENIVTR